MDTMQRKWPELEEHLRQAHPDLAQVDAVLTGSFDGLLTAFHFETDNQEASWHRTKTAATLHQISKRNLLDEDIDRVVNKMAQKLQMRQTQQRGLVKLIQQLRDYLDYKDVLNAI